MLAEIVKYLNRIRFDDLPSEVVEKAKLCVLDSLGVALAGSVTPVGRVARQFALSMGKCDESTIFNYGDRVCCTAAAYANGTMSFCHNFTDTTLSCVVHCGPVVIPTVLSMAQREKKTGKDALLAIIIGYEMMTRIGNAINSGRIRMSHHSRGFHATSTTGVFGSCISASKLLGLSDKQTINALGVAGSYASGILESITSPETEVWRSHPGIASQNGASAALLAKFGMKGPISVLEGKNGFFRAFNAKNVEIGKLTEDLGNRFCIMDSAFKLHNCAHVWAGPLDCIKTLVENHSFGFKDVVSIRVAVPNMYSYVMEGSERYKHPSTYAEAQNNPFYAIAAFIIYGELYIRQYGKTVLNDRGMRKLMEKVSIRRESALDRVFQSGDKTPTRVRIDLKDKTHFSISNDYPRGTPQNPANKQEIWGKFRNLAKTVIKQEQVERLIESVNALEKLDDFEKMFDYLVPKVLKGKKS